jgi:predicted tellurium resistance membrane protein TerC
MLLSTFFVAAASAAAFSADPATTEVAANAFAAPAMSAENAVAFTTLTAMEVVLGIDNIVFIAILCARLPEPQREKARLIGLALAMVTRIALLFTVKWIMGLSKTVLLTMPVLDHGVTGRDLVLLGGGLFLIWKATKEIYHKVEGDGHGPDVKDGSAKFWPTIGQILVIDLVFSLDSIITAVGMARNIWVMAAAVVTSIIVMLVVSGRIAAFIDRHPSVKMLALSFLLLIGVMLVADSMGEHIPKGYIYTAMAFSLGVEVLNLWSKKKRAKLAVAA